MHPKISLSLMKKRLSFFFIIGIDQDIFIVMYNKSTVIELFNKIKYVCTNLWKVSLMATNIL